MKAVKPLARQCNHYSYTGVVIEFGIVSGVGVVGAVLIFGNLSLWFRSIVRYITIIKSDSATNSSSHSW